MNVVAFLEGKPPPYRELFLDAIEASRHNDEAALTSEIEELLTYHAAVETDPESVRTVLRQLIKEGASAADRSQLALASYANYGPGTRAD